LNQPHFSNKSKRKKMGLFKAIGSYFSAGKEQKGAEQATDYLMRQREQAQKKAGKLYGEYLPAGGFGMDALQRQYDVLIGGDMSKFRESPGYQYAMEQGVQALERGASARGGLLGGRQMKELTRFGQGLASQDFGAYLQQLSGFGGQALGTGLQGAAGVMGQYGGVSGGQVAQGLMNIGIAKGNRASAAWGIGEAVQDDAMSALGWYQGRGKTDKTKTGVQ
jgi:hypothetical protein